MSDLLPRLSKETGIDQTMLEAMSSLNKIYQFTNLKANNEQKKQIQLMLVHLIGNMDINKKLVYSVFEQPEYNQYIRLSMTEDLRRFSYKTRHAHQLDYEDEKAWLTLATSLNSKQPLEIHQKISLKQYGMLHELAGLHPFLVNLNNKELIKGNDTLEQLFDHCQKAHTIVSNMQEYFAKNFKMPRGTTFFYKAKAISDEPSLFLLIMTFFITRFVHAAMGNRSSQSQSIQAAHLVRNKNYSTDSIDFYRFLYSDGYKINLSALISMEHQQLLRTHFGTEWESLVKQKFSAIERAIHDHTSLNRARITLDFSIGRYILLAVAWLLGGHKNFFFNDHSNVAIRNEVYGASKWKKEAAKDPGKVLCSEFVGKTLIATMQELNDELTGELKRTGAQNIPDTLIKSPLSKREKLYLLTPERLLTAMEERGAVKRIKPPKLLNEIIEFKEEKNRPSSANHFGQK